MSVKGKVVVVTGCNTGIGKETVRTLAKEGAKVYMACRDMVKCEQARDEVIKSLNNTGDIHCRQLDLSDLESVRTFAANFLQEEEKLNILINNAGVMMGPRRVTKQGIENQFGTNHVGHFLLTSLLLDTIKESAPSRIIVVSSYAHEFGKINFEDLNSEKSYSPMGAYGQSKLANVLFARELARKLQGTGVTVNSLHPGAVATELQRSTWWLNNFVAKCFMKTPVQGAATTLHLALSPRVEGVTGKYFSDKKETRTSNAGQDDKVATRLWEVTEEIIKKHTK